MSSISDFIDVVIQCEIGERMMANKSVFLHTLYAAPDVLKHSFS